MLTHRRERPLDIKKHTDVFDAQRTSSELLKLARKLRWMGIEDEADRVQSTLRMTGQAGRVLSAHRETD